MKTLAYALTGILSLTAPAFAQDATAMMKGPDGADMGQVTLTRAASGVLVQADLKGLAPGAHGFHIHAVGTCEPDFAAAGDHFNPENREHGYMNEAGHHAGDMPNITAGADGTAKADVFNASISLDPASATALMDSDGAAVIVHENPDSYMADAGAGGRVACGVIQQQ